MIIFCSTIRVKFTKRKSQIKWFSWHEKAINYSRNLINQRKIRKIRNINGKLLTLNHSYVSHYLQYVTTTSINKELHKNVFKKIKFHENIITTARKHCLNFHFPFYQNRCFRFRWISGWNKLVWCHIIFENLISSLSWN